MIDSLGADKRECCLADPSPKLDVFLMAVCLQALLCLEVEQLQRPALGLQCYDGLSQMHDGAVGADRPSNHIVRVFEVDDDRLGGRAGLGADLAHADVLIRLERLWSVLVPVMSQRDAWDVRTQFCHDIDAACLSC